MNPFHLQIVTPDGLCFDGEVESLLVRTDNGDVEILRGHTDLFASLGIGRARLIVGGATRYASCAGGFLSVAGGEVKLVATTFEFGEDIDLARARAAKEGAESLIKSATDERALTRAKAKLMRALNRIKVAEGLK